MTVIHIARAPRSSMAFPRFVASMVRIGTGSPVTIRRCSRSVGGYDFVIEKYRLTHAEILATVAVLMNNKEDREFKL